MSMENLCEMNEKRNCCHLIMFTLVLVRDYVYDVSTGRFPTEQSSLLDKSFVDFLVCFN